MVSLAILDMELGGAEFNVDFLQVDRCHLKDPVANINADQMESVVFSVMMKALSIRLSKNKFQMDYVFSFGASSVLF